MKRICKIEIENSRAYYDKLVLSLEKGENLLIYGENGSGKTSLFKAIRDIIQSFYLPVKYKVNRYKPAGSKGEILLSIGDFNSSTRQLSNIVQYGLKEGIDNTQVQNTGYLKALAQSNGFLSYRDLLKVYLYEEDNPNLFAFFVIHLLKNHVPIKQGGQKALGEEWLEINSDLLMAINRKDNRHRRGLNRLNHFELVLRSVLTDLFAEVNKYLSLYFDTFGLSVNYDLAPMTFSYGNGKKQWKIQQVLHLDIHSGNSRIIGYTEELNEARLSALAICLYLAALQANPGSDMSLMFLDDIFIGIDSANRVPILRILGNEFKNFQIMMATYDRSWYCLAQKFLMRSHPGEWKYVSLFSLPRNSSGVYFMEPVMVDGDSYFDTAKEYLHGGRRIDLPAAANYFRKALENLLSTDNLPKELFIGDDYSVIPGYKLTNHVERVANLFPRIGLDPTFINLVDTYLHPLIHPLSHHEEEAQVYRNDLLEIEVAYNELYRQVMDFGHHCRLLNGKHSKLEIRYVTADQSYWVCYEILLEDNLWLFKDASGTSHLTDCPCRAIHLEDGSNGTKRGTFTPNPTDARFQYTSLDDALHKTYDHEFNVNGHPVLAHNDYDIVSVRINRTQTDAFTNRRDQLLATM